MPGPITNPLSPETVTKWKNQHGNSKVQAEYDQQDYEYCHDLADHNNSFTPNENERWKLLTSKIFAVDTLKDANTLNADLSGYVVKISTPDHSDWKSLKDYIEDAPQTYQGKNDNNPDNQMENLYHNTIDLGVLLLKGTDEQVKTILHGTFYNEKTVFHSDDAFNTAIHNRLDIISTESDEAAADLATFNYKDLRQESVALPTPPTTVPLDVVALYEKLQGDVMGDGATTPIPQLSGTLAQPLKERDSNKNSSYEQRKTLEALRAALHVNDRLDQLSPPPESTPVGSPDYEQEISTLDSRVAAITDIPTATFENRQDFRTELKIEVASGKEELYSVIASWAEPDSQEKIAHNKMVRSSEGILVAETPVVPEGVLTIKNVLFDHVPVYNKGRGLPQDTYFVAEDERKNRFIIPMSDKVIDEVIVGKRGTLGGGLNGGVEQGMRKFRNWLENAGITTRKITE
jgi:hypothetical protein